MIPGQNGTTCNARIEPGTHRDHVKQSVHHKLPAGRPPAMYILRALILGMRRAIRDSIYGLDAICIGHGRDSGILGRAAPIQLAHRRSCSVSVHVHCGLGMPRIQLVFGRRGACFFHGSMNDDRSCNVSSANIWYLQSLHQMQDWTTIEHTHAQYTQLTHVLGVLNDAVCFKPSVILWRATLNRREANKAYVDSLYTDSMTIRPPKKVLYTRRQ